MFSFIQNSVYSLFNLVNFTNIEEVPKPCNINLVQELNQESKQELSQELNQDNNQESKQE
jgi:hypothetical protein